MGAINARRDSNEFDVEQTSHFSGLGEYAAAAEQLTEETRSSLLVYGQLQESSVHQSVALRCRSAVNHSLRVLAVPGSLHLNPGCGALNFMKVSLAELEGAESVLGHAADPTESVLGVSPELEAALATLPDRQREILALRFGGDLTGPEIAELTGLSLANVQQILSRSLRQLRANLDAEAAPEPS